MHDLVAIQQVTRTPKTYACAAKPQHLWLQLSEVHSVVHHIADFFHLAVVNCNTVTYGATSTHLRHHIKMTISIPG